MRVLTYPALYAAQLGTVFAPVDAPAGAPDFTLRAVEPLGAPAGHTAFRLLLHAPRALHGQRLHGLQHAALGELHPFLVPTGRSADGFAYEAVFSLSTASETAGTPPAANPATPN